MSRLLQPVFALSLLSLAACTVGPDFLRPEGPRVEAWASPQKAAPSQVVTSPLDERWWDVFNDPQLSALSRRVLTDNLDLQLATSRLQQSRAARQVITAERYPTSSASGGYARKRNSGEGLNDPSGHEGKSAFNLWDAGFSASWELDFWGRVRRETEAADATLEVAENDRRGVLLSVLAETAQDYIQLRGVQSTRAVTEQNLDVARHSLKLSQLRLADGVATDLDVAEAAAQVATIESQLPALQQRQAQLINALSLLMGEPPQALHAELAADAPVPQTPSQVAIGLPSQLAERRPDIRQAEARLHAATASIGVAKGDFYPRITLSGNFGSQAMQLSDFGSWGSRQFGIGPQFSLPLFDGGRLRGMLHLREAQQQEAAVAYQQTVLRAWHEIDDQLTRYNSSQLRRDSLAEAVRQNQIALRTAQQQYVEGVVDFVNVLTVQGALLATQEQLVESSTGVSLAMVGLYKALGGGWESVYPLAAAQP
ncbi:Efflux transport system, outer membrane factor (OMF) lipoprotein [Pseudomonas chlororaphis subsp. aurantiaca]|uniref:efflux transporter outer membrane subunit n=1 Tax=Pseudomonas chlororaphis TaxID=587753 RepID=UPI00050D7509|nr:efflux transporter outer membrane subunit [Pseudomonas chlororaphis]AIS15730.1 RND transporter [Pseudomonas chlororaphis subsp. aurantiaca]AZD32929.1 Efflux transport system, outer membrane factor (OMF) lipoprotein [Pseudomonas chlororaphis subsp. aurantiaca]AZD39259.1 Efflux transport system, outer membrane factor (OMF) lipoprotein [Pseudomonas chlororaphis subsp. aurantiaca]AZD45601.1 Efflux transport system, outer membrane factor (OMF) lipoprotein [Pseudomonas chlororaphis subsp. aurantia